MTVPQNKIIRIFLIYIQLYFYIRQLFHHLIAYIANLLRALKFQEKKKCNSFFLKDIGDKPLVHFSHSKTFRI